MSVLEKILGLAGVGSSLAHVTLLRRFLAGIATVIALVAIASVMAGALISVGFYALYMGLMRYGMDPDAALITVSSIAFVSVVVLAAVASARWRELRGMPRMFAASTPMGRIVDAFLAGLNGEGRY